MWKDSFRRSGKRSDRLDAVRREPQTDPALILLVARLDETAPTDQFVDQLTAGGLMYAHSSGKLCHPYISAALNFLENPHLRPGKAATLLHLPEMPAQSAVDHPKLLENRQGQLLRGYW